VATLNLTPGATVRVVQPTVGLVSVVRGSRSIGVVAVPAGASAGLTGYEHVQSVPASTWIISLPAQFPARRPAVSLYVNDEMVESDIVWSPGIKTVTVTFPSPIAGVAVIT